MLCQQMHATNAASFCQSSMPAIYKEVEQQLTGYGLTLFNKQVQASGNYVATPLTLTYYDDQADVDVRPDRSWASIDPDLSDHPRGITAGVLRNSLPAEHREVATTFVVKILHTITTGPTAPHYIILFNKIEGRECFQEHMCTCGTGVRTGVPCRHFWSVLRSTTCATFNCGLVNDLWFKAPQALGQSQTLLFAFDSPSPPSATVETDRTLYHNQGLVDSGVQILDETTDEAELRTLISAKRFWGIMQGLAKKAIETSILTGQQTALQAVLTSFAGGNGRQASESGTLAIMAGCDRPVVANPDRVKTKGRPNGTHRVGKCLNGQSGKRGRPPLNPIVTNIPGCVPRDAVSPDPEDPALATQQSGYSGDGDEHVSQGGENPTKKLRRCGGCRVLTNHDKRNCPAVPPRSGAGVGGI